MNTSELVKQRIIELCMKKRRAFNALAHYSGIPESTMKSIVSGNTKNPGVVTIKKFAMVWR